MECTSHSPSYLVRNAHSYCFRLVVPKNLQVFVGRTELRYSLGTGRIGVAKQKSRVLAGKIQIIFKVLRKGFSWMGKLSENQIQQLVGVYIKKSIEELDKVFEGGEGTYRPFDDPPSLFNYLKELGIKNEDLMINLNLGDFSMLEKSIDAFLKANGIDEVNKASPEYRRLCIEIHKAETKLIPIQQKHMQCDFSYKDDLPKLFPEVYPAKENPPPPPPPGDRPPKKGKENSADLEKVFREYWDENEPRLKLRSKPEYQRALDHFISFAGKATNIEEVDADVLRRYKQKLLKEEIRSGKTRSIKTINDKYLTLVKGFLNYAKHHGYRRRQQSG
jgi:hypothetical protein